MTCRPQSIANHFGVSLYKNNVISILAFSFAGFMAEQVASVSAAALCLARSGHFEPLLHPFVSFLLRHGRNSLVFINAMQVMNRRHRIPLTSGGRSISDSPQNFPATFLSNENHRGNPHAFGERTAVIFRPPSIDGVFSTLLTS